MPSPSKAKRLWIRDVEAEDDVIVLLTTPIRASSSRHRLSAAHCRDAAIRVEGNGQVAVRRRPAAGQTSGLSGIDSAAPTSIAQAKVVSTISLYSPESVGGYCPARCNTAPGGHVSKLYATPCFFNFMDLPRHNAAAGRCVNSFDMQTPSPEPWKGFARSGTGVGGLMRLPNQAATLLTT
jgi:hypothetical protein